MTCELKQARIEARLLSVYAGRIVSSLRRALSNGRPLTPVLDTMTCEFMRFGIAVPTPNGPVKFEADPRIPDDVEVRLETLRQIVSGGLTPSFEASGTAAAASSPRLSEVAETFSKMAAVDGKKSVEVASNFNFEVIPWPG